MACQGWRLKEGEMHECRNGCGIILLATMENELINKKVKYKLVNI